MRCLVMKSVIIQPFPLNGKVKIPPSKSLSHRAVIAAGLSNGECAIDNISMSEDIIATCEIMKKLGVNIKQFPNNLKVCGKGKLELECTETVNNEIARNELQCNESGSTLRFLIPIAMPVSYTHLTLPTNREV